MWPDGVWVVQHQTQAEGCSVPASWLQQPKLISLGGVGGGGAEQMKTPLKHQIRVPARRTRLASPTCTSAHSEQVGGANLANCANSANHGGRFPCWKRVWCPELQPRRSIERPDSRLTRTPTAAHSRSGLKARRGRGQCHMTDCFQERKGVMVPSRRQPLPETSKKRAEPLLSGGRILPQALPPGPPGGGA